MQSANHFTKKLNSEMNRKAIQRTETPVGRGLNSIQSILPFMQFSRANRS